MIYYRDSHGVYHAFVGEGPYELSPGATAVSQEAYEQAAAEVASERAAEQAAVRPLVAAQRYVYLRALGVDEETARIQSGYEGE